MQFASYGEKGIRVGRDRTRCAPQTLMTLFAIVLAWTSLNNFATAAETPVKPNIVVIMSDYMGYHDSEPYGATDISTPALSRLASEGVLMTDFYAAAPVCGPSRAAFFTGQYPARTGFEQNIRTEKDGLSSSIPSLPKWLKGAGYRTALFGKWHLGSAPDFTPNAHGFDEFIGHHQWTIGYYNHKTEQGEPGLYENDRVVERDGYLTDLLTNEAVDFIGRNQDQPFFLTLAYNAALPPYQPPGWPESKWHRISRRVGRSQNGMKGGTLTRRLVTTTYKWSSVWMRA